jgi:hypothetical protein
MLITCFKERIRDLTDSVDALMSKKASVILNPIIESANNGKIPTRNNVRNKNSFKEKRKSIDDNLVFEHEFPLSQGIITCFDENSDVERIKDVLGKMFKPIWVTKEENDILFEKEKNVWGKGKRPEPPNAYKECGIEVVGRN